MDGNTRQLQSFKHDGRCVELSNQPLKLVFLQTEFDPFSQFQLIINERIGLDERFQAPSADLTQGDQLV